MTRDGECTRCGLLEDEHQFMVNGCDGYQRDPAVVRTRQAVDAFGDAVQELVRAVASYFSQQSILGLRVSEDLGLAVGVPQGKVAAIATACGMVRVDVEPNPRRDETIIAELRGALAAAVAEIDNHNSEYQHRTPKEKLDHWRRLYAGEAGKP